MKLLLIHTGGTIGMAETPQGLAPKAGLVEAALADRLPESVTLIPHVFAPLLDSSDIGPGHWNEMLGAIDANSGTPVILTHGTDTMAFSGAALAQALAGQDRRVVLCGAMTPLAMGGDAEANLSLALKTALEPGPGVFLCFAGKVMPAGGLIKHESHAADAFRAIPQAPLKAPARRRFDGRRLAILTLSPAIPAPALRAMLDALDGAVLRLYGAGTAMSDPGVMDTLKGAVLAGKRLRAVSQCETGGLAPGTYAAGKVLWDAGVENGGTETPEAALIRLWLS